jgi:hypothetical protein
VGLVGCPAQAVHEGIPLVRALLLVAFALLFVMTVSLVFIRDTGPLEKLAVVAVAVLLAFSVRASNGSADPPFDSQRSPTGLRTHVDDYADVPVDGTSQDTRRTEGS